LGLGAVSQFWCERDSFASPLVSFGGRLPY
jgi:hypothetical protein